MSGPTPVHPSPFEPESPPYTESLPIQNTKPSSARRRERNRSHAAFFNQIFDFQATEGQPFAKFADLNDGGLRTAHALFAYNFSLGPVFLLAQGSQSVIEHFVGAVEVAALDLFLNHPFL